MRKDLILKYNLLYDPAYVKAQDYELWCRCGRYFPLANIDEVLMLYRQHNTADIIRITREQQRFAEMIQLQEIRNLGVEPTIEEIELHKEISLWRIHVNQEFVHRNRIWFEKLIEANSRTHYYPEPAFSENIKKRWLKIVEFLESEKFISDNSLLSDHI
jgi:DNA-binding transcriptional MerR regulator